MLTFAPIDRMGLFATLGNIIAKAFQNPLRLWTLNEAQKILAQCPIRAIAFHRHRMNDRLISFLGCNGCDTDTRLLFHSVRTKDDAGIRSSAQHVIQHASGIGGHVKAIL